MANAQYSQEIQTLVDAWQSYLASVDDWQKLVQGVEPQATGCGPARVVVGNEVRNVAVGDIVITPSGTAHYAIPNKEHGLVLGVVNTPPFKLENNIDVTETDPDVGYDHLLFQELTQAGR